MTYQEIHYGPGPSGADLHTRTPGSSRMREVLNKAHHSQLSSVLTKQLQTDTGDHGTPRHNIAPSNEEIQLEELIIM